MEAELKKFNEVQTGKRNEYRRKVKEGKMGGAKGEEEGGEEGEEEDDEEGRAKKRVRREEGEEGMEEGDEGRRESRESGTGDPSAQLQTGYREYDEPEDPDDDDDDGFDAEGQGAEEGGDDTSNLQLRPRGEQDEEDEEGEDDEEDEEEEGDEDEYPDEGRRLSSVEREANGSLDGRGDDAPTPGTSADEAFSEDEGSD